MTPRLTIGSVTLPGNLLLAPIAGYCDLAFRLVVRDCTTHDPHAGPDDLFAGYRGVAMTSTDLLCPQALLSENEKSLWLAATDPADQPMCMQLYGADADVLADAARWAEDHGAAVIDINMGCPVDKVTKKNGGSMLLCDPASTLQLARKVVDAVKLPVTAKIRLGWDDSRLITETLPPALADVGIRMVTVHGRTTEQKFRGDARLDTGGLDCIKRVVDVMADMHPDVPVIGNGDVKSVEHARRMFDVTGCAGIMIGRGALGQPWLFRDICHELATGQAAPPLSRAQRVQLIIRHFENLRRYRGDRIAVNTIRQRMSWYSAHLQPWPGLRQAARAIQTPEAFDELMRQLPADSAPTKHAQSPDADPGSRPDTPRRPTVAA